MRHIWQGFMEECYALFHSMSALMVIFLGVVFYSILYPMPFRNQVAQDLPILVVDQDRSTLSRTLLRMIDATEGAHVARVYSDAPVALQDLREGRGEAVLIIPSDFSRNLLRGSRSVLPLYCDAGYLLPYRVVFRSIRLAVENMGAGVRIQRFQSAGMPELSAKSLQLRGQVAFQTLYNPATNYAFSTIPPVFLLILQQTLLIGSAILAGYHLVHIRTPWTMPGHLVGRMLFLTSIYLVHALYYMWFLPVWYDLPRVEATSHLLLFLLPFFLACAAAGSLFARFARSPEAALVAILPCSLPILFLSGFTWPLEAFPPVLQAIAQVFPSTPAITGYMLMSGRGASFREVLPLWIQLWGLMLIYFSLAWIVLQRETNRIRSRQNALSRAPGAQPVANKPES